MKEFPSLKEFLLLDQERAKGAAFITIYERSGSGWVTWYDTAKASWEKYGDEGPKPGSTVVSLVSGFGGGPGIGLTVVKLVGDGEGYSPEYVDKYLLLSRPGGGQALLELKYWWKDVRPA